MRCGLLGIQRERALCSAASPLARFDSLFWGRVHAGAWGTGFYFGTGGTCFFYSDAGPYRIPDVPLGVEASFTPSYIDLYTQDCLFGTFMQGLVTPGEVGEAAPQPPILRVAEALYMIQRA